MTVTLLTVQTLTGSGTAITTLLPYTHPQSPKNLIGSARITKVVWAVRGEQLLHTSYATEKTYTHITTQDLVLVSLEQN